MLISLMGKLVKMLKFLFVLSLLWRSPFAPDWDGPRSANSIPMGIGHWAAKSVSRTDWVTRSQEVSANLAFASEWRSQPHQRRSARSGTTDTPFLIANRHLFTSDRQIALVSSAVMPLRQRSPHIDIHLFSLRTGTLSTERGMGQFISSAAFKLRQSFRTSTDFIRIGSRVFIFDRRQWISAGAFNFGMDIQ